VIQFSVLIIAGIDGRGRTAGQGQETAAITGHMITVGGHGHEIDDVGQGHVTELKTGRGRGRGRDHENVCDGQISVVVMMKINM